MSVGVQKATWQGLGRGGARSAAKCVVIQGPVWFVSRFGHAGKENWLKVLSERLAVRRG